MDLLKKSMRRRKTAVHLALDSLPAHKKALARAYAQSSGELTLHFLPGYAPELNPDESVWSHVKCTGVARQSSQRGEKLGQPIKERLANLQKTPRLVRSFFGAPSVAYISDC